MDTLVNMELFGQALQVGGVGFVVGACVPWAFRLVGMAFDAVRKFVV